MDRLSSEFPNQPHHGDTQCYGHTTEGEAPEVHFGLLPAGQGPLDGVWLADGVAALDIAGVVDVFGGAVPAVADVDHGIAADPHEAGVAESVGRDVLDVAVAVLGTHALDGCVYGAGAAAERYEQPYHNGPAEDAESKYAEAAPAAGADVGIGRLHSTVILMSSPLS